MQAQRAKLTLSGPPQLTSTDLWAQIWSGLSLQFPLRNLHWKPATRTSIRTIQYLDVNLLALESLRQEGASQIPLSILDKPLLNVYVIACEDVETYKNVVKKQIKDWHVQNSERKTQEWVILNVSKSDARQSQTGLLKMRGTVIDRMRADFNVDKKDRCAQLYWVSDLKSPAIWAEVISKVKEGVISAFDQAVSQREEEVKRSELQKTMPGWNFCTFFILKESLASSFEGANLPEDALMQYEELEASFFQVLKDRTLWFGNFIEPSPKDDSLPLLSISKKPYRDLILANTISVFDIRVFLLARQSMVLGQMGRLVDITRKVSVFLGAFGGRLHEYKHALPYFFIESWIYSSALSAVETCDEWAKNRDLDPTSMNGFYAGKGELLASARTQLDKIGIRLGYLPNKQPFSSSSTISDAAEASKSGTDANKRASRQVSNPDILKFLDSKPTFYDSYIRLTNRAIDLFVKAGRRKFALKLHSSLAGLDLFRERFDTALQTFTSLPAHYAPYRWSSLEAYMLFQSIDSHTRMQSDHDRQWIHTAVAFIKASMEHSSTELLSGMTDKNAYVKRVVEEVVKAAVQVEGEHVFQDHSMISLTPLNESARCADGRDGYFIDVVVHNHLPCELPIDKVSLLLSGRGQEITEFFMDLMVAEPGAHVVTLFCSSPNPRTLLVDKAEVRIGRLIFQWDSVGKQKRKQPFATMDPKSRPKLVRLPADPRALRIDIKQPLKVDIAGPSRLSVALFCGRKSLAKANVKIWASNATVDMKEGSFRSGTSTGSTVTFLSDFISIGDTVAEEVIRFDLPYSSADSRDVVKVRAEVEYETLAEPGMIRKISLDREVRSALDLTVSVQDFFRGERLLTKFTISTTTHQHVRISTVDLQANHEDSEKLTITKPGKARAVLTVTPAQPASFIFHIEKRGDVKDPLRLCMTYRLLREEVESVVTRCIKTIFPDSAQWKQREGVHDAIVSKLEGDSSWIEMYETTGEVHLPGTDFKVDGIPDDILERVRQELKAAEQAADEEEWREFTIPVDLPRLDILASTRIDLMANPFDKKPVKRHQAPLIYAGQPITAVISINTSFFWAGPDKKDVKEYKLRFQLEENIKDWLTSGQKRGDLKARNGSTHIVTVTLMALRHGELPLPSVRLSAYPSGEDPSPPSLETYQVHGAERMLILPRGGRTSFFLNVGRE